MTREELIEHFVYEDSGTLRKIKNARGAAKLAGEFARAS